MIGVPTKNLALGMIVDPDKKWDDHEGQLEEMIYPTLRLWANLRAGKGS